MGGCGGGGGDAGLLFPSLFWGPRSLVVHDCRVQTRCVLSDAKISHTNFITGSTTHLHLEATPLSWDECKAHPKTPQRNQNDRQRLTPRCYGNSRERTVMDGPPPPYNPLPSPIGSQSDLSALEMQPVGCETCSPCTKRKEM